MIALGVVQQQAQQSGYTLDDVSGSVAESFNYERLPMDPTNVYADYTFTGTERTLVALPAVISGPPGVVDLFEGMRRACGFSISTIEPGVIPEFYFQLYNINGSPDSILFHAKVKPDDGEITGTVEMEAGPFPGSLSHPTPTYTGALNGLPVALLLAYDAGMLSCSLYVDSVLIATSAEYETTGGVIAAVQVRDDIGASGRLVLDFVPDVPILVKNNYGAFPAGTIDMSDTLIPDD